MRIISQPRRPQAPERQAQVHYYAVTGRAGQRRLGARRLAKLIRQHWGIENRLHHVLDRTLREDDQKTRVGQGALVLSLLRKLAISALNTLLPKSLSGKYLPEKQKILRDKPARLLRLLKKNPA